MTKPDLVIGDSQQVIAEALKIVLVQQHFAVPAVATSLAGLWELLVTTQPRLCLLDRGAQPARPSPVGADVRWRASYLTDREQQCLTLLVEGLGTAAMANRLGVRTTTVRTHVQSLLSKLGVHSRLEAATLAIRYSLPYPADAVDAPAS